MALGLSKLSPEERLKMGQELRKKDPKDIEQFLLTLTPEERDELLYDPFFHLREDQVPNFPEGKNICLLMCGRGFGKSFAGTRQIKYQVSEKGVKRLAIVAPTHSMIRDTIIFGSSGIMEAYSPNDKDRPEYISSQSLLRWPSGAVAVLISADNPHKVRGLSLEYAYCDEICSWRDGLDLFTNLEMATRLGESKIMITTTPNANDLIVDLYKRKDIDVHLQTGSTLANRAHLSEAMVKRAESLLGTRAGEVEVLGKLILTADGSLFPPDVLDESHVYASEYPPQRWERVVISLDPSGSNKKSADLFGISVVIAMDDGKIVIWEDLSDRYTTDNWAKLVAEVYDSYQQIAPTMITYENTGVGAYVGEILMRENKYLPLKPYPQVTKKASRAMSVSHLMETGVVKMNQNSNLAALEEEMLTWVPATSRKSPDRIDAAVGGVEELIGKRGGVTKSREILF